MSENEAESENARVNAIARTSVSLKLFVSEIDLAKVTIRVTASEKDDVSETAFVKATNRVSVSEKEAVSVAVRASVISRVTESLNVKESEMLRDRKTLPLPPPNRTAMKEGGGRVNGGCR